MVSGRLLIIAALVIFAQGWCLVVVFFKVINVVGGQSQSSHWSWSCFKSVYSDLVGQICQHGKWV